MAGCEAGGATFAVAHAIAGSADAGRELDAGMARGDAQPAGEHPVAEAPAAVPRAAASPAPVAARHPGPAGEAAAKAATSLWFAQQRPDGMALYQATVLGKPSSSDALATFFEGMRVP